MENRILRNFLTVAREGNITVASDKLHISQSALSRQMKDLEEELGQPLLVRQPHCVSLTNAGELLVKRASEILSLVDDTILQFHNLSNEVSGEIYIGAPELFSMADIFTEIARFREEYPNVLIHIYSGAAEGVTKRLNQGILDFAFLLTPTDITGFNSMPTNLKEPWGLVMPNDCPVAAKEFVTPEDFQTYPLLISRQTLFSIYQNDIIDWLGCDLQELNITGTFNMLYNAGFMIREGVGYALAFDNLINYGDDLCFRPLSPEITTSVNFVWKRNKNFSTPGQLLFDHLTKYFQEDPQETDD